MRSAATARGSSCRCRAKAAELTCRCRWCSIGLRYCCASNASRTSSLFLANPSALPLHRSIEFAGVGSRHAVLARVRDNRGDSLSRTCSDHSPRAFFDGSEIDKAWWSGTFQIFPMFRDAVCSDLRTVWIDSTREIASDLSMSSDHLRALSLPRPATAASQLERQLRTRHSDSRPIHSCEGPTFMATAA